MKPSTKDLLNRYHDELVEMVPTKCVLNIAGSEFPVFIEHVQQNRLWAIDKYEIVFSIKMFVCGEGMMYAVAKAIRDARDFLYRLELKETVYSVGFTNFLTGYDDG